MVITARSLAAGLPIAVVHALIVGLRADEVGESLGVFRGVGLLAIAANTAEAEGFLEGCQISMFANI